MAEKNKKTNNFSLTGLFQKIQVNCMISSIYSICLKIWYKSASRPSFLFFSKFLPRQALLQFIHTSTHISKILVLLLVSNSNLSFTYSLPNTRILYTTEYKYGTSYTTKINIYSIISFHKVKSGI